MNQKKVAEANKLMGKAGKLEFTNGKGEFGGLEQMFAQFEKLKSLSTQQQLTIIRKIFGDDAETLQAVSLIINKGIDGYREIQQKMEAQATLQERVNVQLGTLRNLWDATSGTFTNALVALGESIAPEVKAITEWLGKLAEKLGAWAKENPRLANIIMKTTAILGILLFTIGGLLLAAAAVIGPYAILYVAFAKLGVSGGILVSVLRGIGQAVLFIGRALLLNPVGLAIIGIAVAAFLIYKYWGPFSSFVTGLWNEIKAAFSGGILGIFTLLTNWSPLGLFYKAFSAVLKWFGIDLPAKFTEFGSMIIDGLIIGIKQRFNDLVKAVREFGALVAETFQASQNMHSPSRLFMEYGGYLTEGLAIGINRGQNKPIQQIKALSDQIQKTSSGIIFNNSSSEGLKIDRRPPISSTAWSPAFGSGETKIEITINPVAGSDPNAIARAVAMELDRREREKATRMRGSYIDY